MYHTPHLTRLQAGLVTAAVGCACAGGAAVRARHEVAGIGLWQAAVLLGGGAMAAGLGASVARNHGLAKEQLCLEVRRLEMIRRLMPPPDDQPPALN